MHRDDRTLLVEESAALGYRRILFGLILEDLGVASILLHTEFIPEGCDEENWVDFCAAIHVAVTKLVENEIDSRFGQFGAWEYDADRKGNIVNVA